MINFLRKLFSRDYILFGAFRSPLWKKVRDNFLEKNPYCAICLKTEELSVHHKFPFAKFPSLELEISNLVTLCESSGMNCHITFGHLGSWKNYNPAIETDIIVWRDKIKNRL